MKQEKITSTMIGVSCNANKVVSTRSWQKCTKARMKQFFFFFLRHLTLQYVNKRTENFKFRENKN